jgi:hypothetical protein
MRQDECATNREVAERAGTFEPVGPERAAAAPLIHWGRNPKLGAVINWAEIAHKERDTVVREANRYPLIPT